jgi:hypothetical protein
MQLIRFDGNKTGLVVELPSGKHVVDVIASVGALAPEDPISHGILNGLLKDNGSWAQLLAHWEMARKGLHRLAVLARAPGSTQVVLRSLDEVRGVSACPPDGIGSLDIRESDGTALDPTGRNVIEGQLAELPVTTGQPEQGNQFESRNRSEAVLLRVQFGGRDSKPREFR